MLGIFFALDLTDVIDCKLTWLGGTQILEQFLLSNLQSIYVVLGDVARLCFFVFVWTLALDLVVHLKLIILIFWVRLALNVIALGKWLDQLLLNLEVIGNFHLFNSFVPVCNFLIDFSIALHLRLVGRRLDQIFLEDFSFELLISDVQQVLNKSL